MARNTASGLILSDSKVHIQDSLLANAEQSEDFPLTGGFVVLINSSEASIERCVVMGGRAAEGGGIKVLRESYLFVSECVFKGNEATKGGDIYAFNHKSIVVKNSHFSSSWSSIALESSSAETQITNNTFHRFLLWNPLFHFDRVILKFQHNAISFIDFEDSSLHQPLMLLESPVLTTVSHNKFTLIHGGSVVRIAGDQSALSQTVLITHNSFLDIYAEQNGGALSFFNMNGVVRANSFERVYAIQSRGGAIFIEGTLPFSV